VLEVSEKEAKFTGKVEAGKTFVDGLRSSVMLETLF
jgi:hypothetical protein